MSHRTPGLRGESPDGRMTSTCSAAGPAQDLPQGRRRGPRAARRRPRGRPRRVRRDRRRQRLRQEHAAAPARHARRARRRRRSTSTASGSTTCPTAQRDALRNRTFGFIFQFYHLLPELTTLENVLMPPMIRHGALVASWGSGASSAREAAELLERVGLGHRLDAPAARAVRRRDAAGGHRPGPGRRPARSCWPTSRPATSTPATGQEILRPAPRLEPRARA